MDEKREESIKECFRKELLSIKPSLLSRFIEVGDELSQFFKTASGELPTQEGIELRDLCFEHDSLDYLSNATDSRLAETVIGHSKSYIEHNFNKTLLDAIKGLNVTGQLKGSDHYWLPVDLSCLSSPADILKSLMKPVLDSKEYLDRCEVSSKGYTVLVGHELYMLINAALLGGGFEGGVRGFNSTGSIDFELCPILEGGKCLLVPEADIFFIKWAACNRQGELLPNPRISICKSRTCRKIPTRIYFEYKAWCVYPDAVIKLDINI
jgi:hypothetical protein